MSIEDLPDELLLEIILNSQPTEIGRLCQTSPTFRRLCNDQALWHALLVRDYSQWRFLFEDVSPETIWRNRYLAAHHNYFLHDRPSVTLYRKLEAALGESPVFISGSLWGKRDPNIAWDPSLILSGGTLEGPNNLLTKLPVSYFNGGQRLSLYLGQDNKTAHSLFRKLSFITSNDVRKSRLTKVGGLGWVSY